MKIDELTLTPQEKEDHLLAAAQYLIAKDHFGAIYITLPIEKLVVQSRMEGELWKKKHASTLVNDTALTQKIDALRTRVEAVELWIPPHPRFTVSAELTQKLAEAKQLLEKDGIEKCLEPLGLAGKNYAEHKKTCLGHLNLLLTDARTALETTFSQAGVTLDDIKVCENLIEDFRKMDSQKIPASVPFVRDNSAHLFKALSNLGRHAQTLMVDGKVDGISVFEGNQLSLGALYELCLKQVDPKLKTLSAVLKKVSISLASNFYKVHEQQPPNADGLKFLAGEKIASTLAEALWMLEQRRAVRGAFTLYPELESFKLKRFLHHEMLNQLFSAGKTFNKTTLEENLKRTVLEAINPQYDKKLASLAHMNFIAEHVDVSKEQNAMALSVLSEYPVCQDEKYNWLDMVTPIFNKKSVEDLEQEMRDHGIYDAMFSLTEQALLSKSETKKAIIDETVNRMLIRFTNIQESFSMLSGQSGLDTLGAVKQLFNQLSSSLKPDYTKWPNEIKTLLQKTTPPFKTIAEIELKTLLLIQKKINELQKTS